MVGTFESIITVMNRYRFWDLLETRRGRVQWQQVRQNEVGEWGMPPPFPSKRIRRKALEGAVRGESTAIDSVIHISTEL